MALFQLLSVSVNLGGSRDSVTHRGTDNPATYPEALVLAAVHGGPEHVHGHVVVGEVERDPGDEFERLARTYGPVVNDLFPRVAGRVSMPEGDPSIPTADEAAEVAAAAEAARKRLRKSKAAQAAKAGPAGPTGPAVPELDDLPD